MKTPLQHSQVYQGAGEWKSNSMDVGILCSPPFLSLFLIHSHGHRGLPSPRCPEPWHPFVRFCLWHCVWRDTSAGFGTPEQRSRAGSLPALSPLVNSQQSCLCSGPTRDTQPTMKFVMDTSKYWFKPSITREQGEVWAVHSASGARSRGSCCLP